MATLLRKNDCVQLFIPWKLHTSIFRVFNDFSDHGRLYYEGFRTILLSVVSNYKLSPNLIYNLFKQVKNDEDFLDFELFLLTIEKLSQQIQTKTSNALNNVLCSIGNFYKCSDDAENMKTGIPNYHNMFNSFSKHSDPLEMLNQPTPRESLDLLTQYQPINIGVKYNLDKSYTSVAESIPKLINQKINFADAVKLNIAKNTADAATSARAIESSENTFAEKLKTLDNVFNNTQLLRSDLGQITENYKSIKASEEMWEKTTQILEREKNTLNEQIEMLRSDKKYLTDKIEKLDSDLNDLKSLLDKKEEEIKMLRNLSVALVSLEESLALDSHEETTVFFVFSYYRKLDRASGKWTIDENSLVDFVFDYGLVEEHPTEDSTMPRAKLAFEKASDQSKQLDFIHFKLFLAEYGKMAYLEDDINKALRITIENVIGKRCTEVDTENKNCNYQLEFYPDETIDNQSMPVQGTLWFQ